EDRRVHRQESVADRAREGEAPVEAFGVEVVEEDAADAARLLAMTQIEVIVAGALHLRIERGAVRRERGAARRMEFARVPLVAVVGREIHAAAEPPCRRSIARRLVRDE